MSYVKGKFTENEKIILEYMNDNSDDTGFDGSMKDIADIMDIPVMDVLKFFNKCFHMGYLKRINASRHEFLQERIQLID